MARAEKKGIKKTGKTGKTRKKRRGLKAFLSLVIILAAAGAVFWFGWVQFRIGEGQVGIIYTKSHGYEEKALMNGEFAWRWQALLPTNMTLHLFDLETRSIEFEKKGSLPSAEIYSAMAGGNVDFGWSVKTRFSYRIEPDVLASLVADGLVSGDLDHFYTDYESRLSGELSRIFSSSPEFGSGADAEQMMADLEGRLRRGATEIDPRITVLETSVLDWSLPDMALYAESRRLYLEYMALRQAVLTEVEDGAVRREDLQGARLDLLERYGEILDSYPILLDLFALEGNPGAALLPPENLQ